MDGASIERAILDELERDATAASGEIAERVGVSKPTVRKYIDKLESNGVIVGYSADIDPKKLSGQSIALVGIEVESERYVDAIASLRELDSIDALFTSSGDHMLMAEVRGPNSEAIGQVIQEEIMTIDGIDAAHPSFLQERLK